VILEKTHPSINSTIIKLHIKCIDGKFRGHRLMLGISLRQIEVFASIAATGSVRGAAEHLHLTQPAISMALAELERQLGTPLFDRERGRLKLNARGREQLPLAREILERLGDMLRRNPKH